MKTKIALLLVIIFLNGSSLFCQHYKYLYYFDGNLNFCDQSKSMVTGKGFNDSGLFRLDYFNNQTGNMLMSVHFTDSTLSVMQGSFKTFYPGAVLAEAGEYVKEKKEGLWQEWDENGLKTDSAIYENNTKIRFAKFEYGFLKFEFNKEQKTRSVYTFTDSIEDKFIQMSFNRDGTLSSEVTFTGQKGLLKTYDNGGVKTDSVFTREDEEASFPGGEKAWKNYLSANLDANVAVKNKAPAGIYTVVVKFIVNTNGSLSDISSESYIGYGMEEEAISAVERSRKWLPAKQYGRIVKAYRRQPIIFSINSN